MVRHLLTVWNPTYAHDALEEHLAVLLRLAAACDAGETEAEDVYVWWGKVRSSNRQQPLGHQKEIDALGAAIDAAEFADEGDAPEFHLYLTDYRALYVGELGEIVEALPDGEDAHVPAYYAAERLACDYWFRLYDIRRLVSDDLVGVVEELRKLRNVHYNDRPVSIYGGMVNLPLVVTRPDGQRFFAPDERHILGEGKLWVEFDQETAAGAAPMERALRDDLLGESAWIGLEPAVRVFVASAEKIFREHRDDPAFDFGPVITALAKALEVQVNAVLKRALLRLKQSARQANVNGATVDLSDHRNLSLGELSHVLRGERELAEGVASALEHGSWFTGQLPWILEEFSGVRNAATHAERVDRRTAGRWRDRLLGVGCVGELVELAKVRVR